MTTQVTEIITPLQVTETITPLNQEQVSTTPIGATWFYAPLFVEKVDEDSQGETYHLCSLVARAGTLKNLQGQPVANPAALVIYGLKKVRTGQLVKALVKLRGEGLYTVIEEGSHAEVLDILDVSDIKELPLAAVREFESAYDEETGDLKKTRYGRKNVQRSRRGRNSKITNETVQASTQIQVNTNKEDLLLEEVPA